MKRRLVIFFAIALAAASAAFVVISAPWRPAVVAPYVPSEEVSESLPPAAGVEVRYIANEGVLITARDKRVLIDGLHQKYRDAYAFLPDIEREKIETARPPFENIDVVLVSHMHGDHFHPESVGRYLVSNPKAHLATSEQVVGEVNSKFPAADSLEGRITPIAYSFTDRVTRNIAGIDIEFLSVGHGTDRHAAIQNLGHVFTLGGKKFLHLGDAVPTKGNFEHYALDKLGIDVAFMPAWFLTSPEGRAIIREHIRPKHIIAVHVGPAEADSLRTQIKSEFPEAHVFGTMLEKRTF